MGLLALQPCNVWVYRYELEARDQHLAQLLLCK